MFSSKRTPTPTNVRPVKSFRITGTDVNVTVDVTAPTYKLPDNVDSNAIVIRSRAGDKLVIRNVPFEDAFDPRKFPRQPATVTVGATQYTGVVTYDSNAGLYRLETEDQGLFVFPNDKVTVRYHNAPTPATLALNFKQDEFPAEVKYTIGKNGKNIFWTPVYQLFFNDEKKITKIFLKAKVFNMTSEVFNTKTLSFMVSGTVAGAAPRTETASYRAKSAHAEVMMLAAAAPYGGGADYEAAKVTMDVAAGYTFEGDFTIKQGESTFPLFEIVGKDCGAIDIPHEVYFRHDLDSNETKYGFRIPEVDRYFPNAAVVVFHDRANGEQIKVAETTIEATQPKQELRFLVDKAGEMVTVRVDKTTEETPCGGPEPAGYGGSYGRGGESRTDVYTATVTDPADKKVFYQWTGYGFKSADPKPTRMRGNTPEWEMAADGKNVIKVTHSA